MLMTDLGAAVASSEMGHQIRSMLQTPLEQEGLWVWKRPAHIPRVRFLKKINGADVGLLGQGVNHGVY